MTFKVKRGEDYNAIPEQHWTPQPRLYSKLSMVKNVFAILASSLAVSLAMLLAFASAAVGQSPAASEPEITADITGMYSFLHEGEFVQIEVNGTNVTGLVSHFKDEDSDKAEFVDQYFEQAKLEGTTLSFRTKVADGLWFEFSGTVERGPAKTPSDEGYWIVRGTLIEHHPEIDGKTTAKTHSLNLKSFPQDSEPDPPGARK